MEHGGWQTLRAGFAQRFDRESLESYLEIVGDPLPLIRRGLASLQVPDWQSCVQGLSAHFNLADDHHCFHVPPHRWARYHEPQITAGFSHFLSLGSQRCRVERAAALAKAVATCVGTGTAAMDGLSFDSAVCRAEENRSDIVLELSAGSRRMGVSIEAKFGHQLTKGQLPKARDHVRENYGWEPGDTYLLVIAPDPDTLDALILRQNRRFGWRATSWWEFLSVLERVTNPSFDCEEYRRFRRTVWHRAY